MLYKAIKSGKEKRREYRGEKKRDRTCRNHGSDFWARDCRLYKFKKAELAALQQEIEHSFI